MYFGELWLNICMLAFSTELLIRLLSCWICHHSWIIFFPLHASCFIVSRRSFRLLHILRCQYDSCSTENHSVYPHVAACVSNSFNPTTFSLSGDNVRNLDLNNNLESVLTCYFLDWYAQLTLFVQASLCDAVSSLTELTPLHSRPLNDKKKRRRR